MNPRIIEANRMTRVYATGYDAEFPEERDPRQLQAAGLRPVWSARFGYPAGGIPDDIAELLDVDRPRQPTARYIGPIQSLVWLAGLDHLVIAVYMPSFGIPNVVRRLGFGPVTGIVTILAAQNIIPEPLLTRLFGFTSISSIEFPLQDNTYQYQIPAHVTNSPAMHAIASLFPGLKNDNKVPKQIRSARLKSNLSTTKSIEGVLSMILGRDSKHLYAGMFHRRDVVRLLSVGAPLQVRMPQNIARGPGLYTTNDLEDAFRYTGSRGSLLVFKNPKLRDLHVWEPSNDEVKFLERFWAGQTDSNMADDFPRGYINPDIIKIPTSSTVDIEKFDMTVVTPAAWSNIVSTLEMIIWLQ